MFLGHFAVGLALKKAEPKLSLGALIAGAMAMDVIFAVLLLLGIEHVRISPGVTAVSPFEFFDYPLSHSLTGSLLISVIVFLFAYYIIMKNSSHKMRISLVLSLAVLSHYVLDVISHTPDMPIVGNDSIKLGFSLWNNMAATLIVEFGMLAAGAVIYLKATRSVSFIGKYGLVIFLILLTFLFVAGLVTPPPPDSASLAAFIIIGISLFAALAFWIDQNRE